MSIFKLQHGMAGHKMVLRRSNMRKRMSALGQKQTSRLVRAMSALPPKADIEPRSRDVRFVPKADIRCILALRDNQQNNATDYDGYRSYQLWANVLVLEKYEAQ